MNINDLKHSNLYFFDKNGEYCNFSYEGFMPLLNKPFDWDYIYEDNEGNQIYGKQTYLKLNPENENEYIYCSATDEWGEDRDGNEIFYYTKSDKWVGEIYLEDVATDLFSVGKLLVLEKDNQGNYRLPWKKAEKEFCWIAGFQEDLPDIFLFGYDDNYINVTQSALSQEPDGPDMVRTNFLGIPLSESNEIRKEAAEINFALCSSEENTFKRTLYIYEAGEDYEPISKDIKENIVAVITIYGKTINEDERLKTICANFGYNIIDTDTIAFEKTNVKEIFPDWTIINEKRKEIILEGHNIYPYIGAYKGIINAIKYFGYNELQLREFWRNVDPNSPYYGKYIQTDCVDFLSVDNVRFNQPKVTLPSKQYRKTSLFALVYKINDITPNAYDEDDLPLTHENQTYTQEEILIKLFALKRKLEKDFLPLNARIKDIIGEADFFALNELTNSVGVNIKNNIQVGISPTFEVINGEKYNDLDDKIYANLVDLRTFLVEYYNSTTKTVESAPEVFYDASKTTSELVSWWNMFTAPREKYSLIIDNELVCLESIMTKGSGDHNFSVQKLSEIYLAYFKDYSPNLKHTGYWEDGRQPEYLGDVDPLPDNWHFITSFSLNDDKEYSPFESLTPEEKETFKQWNNPEKLPVGALVLLRNTTFDNFIFDDENKDIAINDLDITYNELAEGNKYDIITLGLENFAEYHYSESDGKYIDAEENEELTLIYDNTIEVAKYYTKTTDTVNTVMKSIYVMCIESKHEHEEILKNIDFYFNEDTNEIEIQGIDGYKFNWNIKHPLMESEFEESVESDMRYSVATSNRKTSDHPLFSWNDINKYDTTGIEWTIKKEATSVSPAYYFNSFEAFDDRDIKKFNELPIVLPYIGTYTIEMRLYNMYNHISSLVKRDYLEVVGREVEFSGWYTSQEETNGFEQEQDEEDFEIYGSNSGTGEDDEIDITTELLNYWSSAAVTPRNNEYTWEKCKDFEIGEYGSPYENAIKPSTTWEEVTSSLYEGLDNANIIENNTLDINDKHMHTSNFMHKGGYSNKGAFVWKNCDCTWDEAYHKSWDTTEETGDIPFYIDIDSTVIGSEGNELQWSGVEDTEVGENGIVRLSYNNPKLSFSLQNDFKIRLGYSKSDPEWNYTFEFAMSSDMNMMELYEELSEWLKEKYNINIERYLIVNYIYNKEDYEETSEIIVSDEKLYIEHSTEEHAEYYEVIQNENGYKIKKSDENFDSDVYEISYLKEIANVDFVNTQSSTGWIGYLRWEENNVIKRQNELIPVVNINKLEEISYRPYYEYDNGEKILIPINDIEDVPTELIIRDSDTDTDIVDTNKFIEGLVPWKYYKHFTGIKENDTEAEPTIWWYTYIDNADIDVDSSDGESTKHINRLIPTLTPVVGVNYTETNNIDEVLDHDNYTKSYMYKQYPQKKLYNFYKVIPCTRYRLIPYIKYSLKPDLVSHPYRMQLTGKYNTQLCDIFDVDVVWNVVMNYEETIASFGLKDTGVYQHNTEIHNPTFNNVKFINSWKKLPKLTRICFTYDKCKILGKRNPTWTFKNLTTGTEKVIRSKYGMYLFTEVGDYSITLELYDSNKNKYIAIKNYLTIV